MSRPLLGPGARGRGPSESLLVCEMREPIAALRVCEDWREITYSVQHRGYLLKHLTGSSYKPPLFYSPWQLLRD